MAKRPRHRKPPPVPLVITKIVEPPPQIADTYTAYRLKIVRAQIRRLDKLILSSTSAQALNWLAAASAKLAEQERQLAGRPMPGSLRPRAERPRLPAAPIEPVAPQPVDTHQSNPIGQSVASSQEPNG